MANNNHFELTLDTLAPSGSITIPKEFLNANDNLTIVKGNASFMKVWRNKTATGTKSDAEYPTAWEAAATSKATNFGADDEGTWYYHLVLMDSVNNESEVYNTESITYDVTVPEVTDAYIQDPDGATAVKKYITNQLNNEFGFNFSDDRSGCVSYEITGVDLAAAITDTISGTSGTVGPVAFSFKDGTQDGTKTLTIKVKDAAGNTSIPVDVSIKLDRALDAPILTLQDRAAEPAAISGYINYHTINAQLASTDDIVAYKLGEGTLPDAWTDVPEYAAHVAIAKNSVVRYGTVPNAKTYYSTEAITAAENTGWEAIASKMSAGFVLRQELTLSALDGLKTVNAAVKDEAGNSYAAVPATITIDTVVPVVTITSVTPLMISNVDGHKTSVVTFSVSDAGAGVNAWALMVNDNKVDEGTAAVTNRTFTITSATGGMTEGSNTISLWARDNATNDKGTSPEGDYNENTTTYAQSLVLDTTAPTASITQMNTWYTTKPGITANTSDAGVGVDAIQAWTSMTSDDTTCPTSAQEITPDVSGSTVIDASKISGDPQQSAANYMHIKVVDKVGNTTYAHAVYGFDSVAPTAITAKFNKDYYNTTAAQIDVTSMTDATSGVKQMKLTGDITLGGGVVPGTWFDITAAPTNVSVTLTDNTVPGKGVEIKKVQIFLKDKAGNESAQLAEISTELDQDLPGAFLELRTADDSATHPAHTNVAEFAAHIAGTDDFAYAYAVNTAYEVGALLVNMGTHDHTVYKVITAITAAENTSFEAISAKLQAQGEEVEVAVEYKIYGDFSYDAQSAAGISEGSASWKQLVYITGQKYMLIPDGKTPAGESSSKMFCTTGDGTKNVYLKVKDNAGNISAAAQQSFVYDTTAPVVTVSDIDYQILSKVHGLRIKDLAPVTGKYADETNFTFTPDSVIQAYKVCAYKNQTTAAAGSHEDAAIPTTAGSVNMSATGISSSSAVNAMIKGADYETALSALATDFSAETSYEVGDLVKYNSKVYTCKKAHTGAWAAADFTEGVDGAHIVTVYVQDLGGTWSAAAVFTI